ncbi:MAG TPA: Rieske 2Fe-2S domain-containing protein [Amycolatopsis sp.]|nr:Rieske 2Fe-2S domain-containing protein [Amycolatopsis sp.]
MSGDDEVARLRQLLRRAAAKDDVDLRTYARRWPVPATRAERRARRRTLAWLGLAVVAGLCFLVLYLAWPWRYVPPPRQPSSGYRLYTPLLGITLGLALAGLSFGIITYARNFLAHEKAVQQRHDEPSPLPDQDATAVILHEARTDAGLTRRSWMGRALGAGAGVCGLGAGVAFVGSFVRDPWDNPASPQSPWHTAWSSPTGERVYLRRVTGDPDEVALARPGDLEPGGVLAAVPFRESERGDPDKLHEALHRADSPVVLVRLRPGQHVTARPGQASFGWHDYYVYSRVCTHLGCPIGIDEQREARLMCPCHSSQFDLRTGAKPVFGPAVRPLPQLPVAVTDDGVFYARSDFTEPVGPSFWELG